MSEAGWNAVAAVSQAVAALVTIGAFVAAWLAARIARGQLEEARKLRAEQSLPYIVVDFEHSPAWDGLLDVTITNIGQTPARDVRVSFDPPLVSTLRESRDGDFQDIAIFKDGIPFVAPERKIRILFERLPSLYEREDLPRGYRAHVSFETDTSGRIENDYVLDLNQYYDWESVRVYGVHDGAKALREIEKRLEKWTAHFNGVRVYSIDSAQYDQEQREAYEERRRQRQRTSEENGSVSPTGEQV